MSSAAVPGSSAPPALPIGPTAEVWAAMSPAQRARFELNVVEALRRRTPPESRRAGLATERAEREALRATKEARRADEAAQRANQEAQRAEAALRRLEEETRRAEAALARAAAEAALQALRAPSNPRESD